MKTIDPPAWTFSDEALPYSSSHDSVCSSCGSRQIFTPAQALRGLERRRHPRGRLECEFASQPWHWQLERLEREICLARDEVLRAGLRSEFERAVLQRRERLENSSPKFNYPILETSLITREFCPAPFAFHLLLEEQTV